MKVIAHRGASAERPENSLAAFELAVSLGADAIELDLRVSCDGVVFAAHDPVARPAGRGVASAAQLRRMAGPEGRYVALAELLDRLAGRIELNLELKERRAVAGVVRELRDPARARGVRLSSFDRLAARDLRRALPGVAQGLLARRLPVRLGGALRHLGAATVHLPRRAVTPRVVRRVHGAGAALWVWTVDCPDEILRLAALGVDGVFTNDPRAVLRILGRERGAAGPAGAGPGVG